MLRYHPLLVLKYLIQEILRVHGPASIFLERVVPKGGATLEGYFLPEGTVSNILGKIVALLSIFSL